MADPLDSIDPESLALARQHYGDDEIRQYLMEAAKDRAFRGGGTRRTDAGLEYARPNPSDLNWEGVNVKEGAPAWDRFLAGFKSGPEGRLNFYKNRYGEANVRTSPGGDLEFYKPETKQWHRVDEEGLSWKDLADLGGDVPELLGMMVAPALRGATTSSKFINALRTAGAGAAGGNIVRQTIGQATPGEEPVSLTDPLKAAAGAEALSYTPSARTVLHPSEAIIDYATRKARAAGNTDIAREGVELSQKTGIPLNLAEITQDPFFQTMLGFAHRSGFGQTPAREEALAKESAALAMFGRLLEKLGGKDAFTNPNYTEAATGAARTALKDIEDKLRGVNYHFMERPEGAVPSIPLTERMRYLKSLADRYRSMGSSDQIEKADEVERIIKQVPTNPAGQQLANPRLIQQMLQESGEEGFGNLPEKAFPRLAAMAGTKESRELWHATRQDLVEAAKTNPLAAKLLAARTRTGELLTQREALQKTPLLAFLNSKGMLDPIMKKGIVPAEDTIIPEMLGGMRSHKYSPGELSNMVRLLQGTNPEFADKMGQAVLADAVKSGFKSGNFSYKDAVAALPDISYLHALWEPGQPGLGLGVASDVQMMLKTLDRISKFGLGIPHSPGSTAVSIAGKLAEGEWGQAGKQAFMNMIYPVAVSKIAFNPKVREQLLTALTQGGQRPLSPFIARFLGQAPFAGAYEAGSSIQQRNQAGFGGP